MSLPFFSASAQEITHSDKARLHPWPAKSYFPALRQRMGHPSRGQRSGRSFWILLALLVWLAGAETALARRPPVLGQTILVTSPNDSGAGSLRQALLTAQPGDLITFDPTLFPPQIPLTISLQSSLPVIKTNALTIDASNAGVVLDGHQLSTGAPGLVVAGAQGVIIRGLHILNFPGDGIQLIGGASHCVIGGDRTLGASRLGQGNRISLNRSSGIYISGSTTTGNQILGNDVGIDASGLAAAGNQRTGITIDQGANHIVIGGSSSNGGNVISGNGSGGVLIQGIGAVNNQLFGNWIGVDRNGATAIPNRGNGVVINRGASNNRIGGESAGLGNLISANVGHGIEIADANTFNNQVQGNQIGLDSTGAKMLGNQGDGIAVADAQNTLIGGEAANAGNHIGGNLRNGIELFGTGATGSLVLGNTIGLERSGAAPLPNGAAGIFISDGAHQNRIGGTSVGARNLLSGNRDDGIHLEDPGSEQNQVLGNYIGMDATGVHAVPNHGHGIFIGVGAAANQIGGKEPGEGNLISGNGLDGISIQEAGAAGNQIFGNKIGVDSSGLRAHGNGGHGITILGSPNNLIGGIEEQAANVISGNSGNGLWLGLAGTTANQVVGNRIGLAAAPFNRIIGNDGNGILIDSGASANSVGGNFIFGNRRAGVWLKDAATLNNTITENEIAVNRHLAAQFILGNRLQENKFSNNQLNFVQVIGGALSTQDETWTAQGDVTTFVVVNQDIIVPPDRTWRLGAGLNVQFQRNLGAQIQGRMEMVGERDKSVRFNSGQQFLAPLPGLWKGILFSAGSSGTLQYAAVEFARNGLTLEGGAVDIISSTIAASQENGILLKQGRLTWQGQNVLAGNGSMAIDNQSGAPITVPNVWWGSAQGPTGPHDSIQKGDRISENVSAPAPLADTNFKKSWQDALVLLPGKHQFKVTSPQDVHWFRVAVSSRNATVSATLSALPHDYDLLLFSGLDLDATVPQDIGNLQGIDPTDTGNLQGIDPTDTGNLQGIPGQIAYIEGCPPMYIGQLADVARAANTARLLTASCATGVADESVTVNTWDQSGWYYLLVAGHNGANALTQPYDLAVTVTPGEPGAITNLQTALFAPPDVTQPFTKTWILTNLTRFPFGQRASLRSQLLHFATKAEVAGELIDLGDSQRYPQLQQLYQKWDNPPGVPSKATRVNGAKEIAAAIKALLITLRPAYPNLQNILIVGGDEIVPFWRVPDEVSIAKESAYQAFATPESQLAAALAEDYFFSDNFYASFNPIPWRGRHLFLPDFALGRLVETPEEMTAALTAFTTTLPFRTGLVVGYDFMQDQAQEIARTLDEYGLTLVDQLIHDAWSADDLNNLWLNQRHDLNSINGHFDHYRAIPAERSKSDLTPGHAALSNQLAGTLVFSVGCHSGLSAADGQIMEESKRLDFAQVLVGRGASYIANTGFGYGDADAIGYSERLMQLLVEHLRDGITVGQALRQAKLQYLNELGVRAMTPYDEKVLSIATLYGLPMYEIDMPGDPVAAADAAPSPVQISEPQPCAEQSSLTCRRADFTLLNHYQPTTDAQGIYYAIQGNAPQIIPAQPIQPRIGVSITLGITPARGAFFEGGAYQVTDPFDPVIARLITQTTQLGGGQTIREPLYTVADWRPTTWDLINTVRTLAGRQERLVVAPAQYRAITAQTGEERRFTTLSYTLYYTATRDTLPPNIWLVTATASEDKTHLTTTVEATDFSDVVRVAIAYTVGDGFWQVTNLQRNPEPEQAGQWLNTWSGSLPADSRLEYFVQALDGSGNVAVHDNKGQYFRFQDFKLLIYLPTIYK